MTDESNDRDILNTNDKVLGREWDIVDAINRRYDDVDADAYSDINVAILQSSIPYACGYSSPMKKVPITPDTTVGEVMAAVADVLEEFLSILRQIAEDEKYDVNDG